MSIKRPLVFDLTHLVSRLAITSPTGIDQVDLMFAKHFVGRVSTTSTAVHYGIRHPHILDPALARSIVKMSEELREPRSDDYNLESSELFFYDPDKFAGKMARSRGEKLGRQIWRLAQIQALRTKHCTKFRIENNAIYLNVAQHLLEFPIFFKWLNNRADILKVFFLHDLIPLDYPEFFPSGYQKRFNLRIQTIIQYGNAIIVSTESVARRAAIEFFSRGRKNVPIHIAPIPSPLEAASIPQGQIELPSAPYFLVIGTMEPRKNHLLLLQIWRELAKGPGPVPILIIVGRRGWETDQVVDLLFRCGQIEPYVFWLNGLSLVHLRALITGARALLMPSLAEGYGLPLVEALSLGTPVIASDIPVFREVCQDCAFFLRPLDGLGWQRTIERMAMPHSVFRADLAAKAITFRAPTSNLYFKNLETFLSLL